MWPDSVLPFYALPAAGWHREFACVLELRCRGPRELAAGAAAAMKRVRLGDWTCPSGNNVVVYLRHDPALEGVEHLEMEWDTPPPLAAADLVHYLDVVLPAVHRRRAEWKEQPVGPAVVVMPDRLPLKGDGS
jgi:hypothetical protein